MLPLLVVLFVYFHGLHGRSLPLRIHPREEESSSKSESFRTTHGIIWSCFVTIFACVWTSAHPNIPSPRDAGWTRLKRRIIMMVYALIAPETIVLWAWRQYEAAEWIVKDYNDEFTPTASANVSLGKASTLQGVYEWVDNSVSTTIQSYKQWWTVVPERDVQRTREDPWSQTHGFFIQMGGFVLYERGVPTQVLDYPHFKRLLKSKSIDAPLITKSDIQDRSKGDAISKGFIVLQTTWFVVHCIARVKKDLPLCELEIITLGFAVLNAMTYAVCWNKPQGVGASFCVPLKDTVAISNIIQDLIDMVPMDTKQPSDAATMDRETHAGMAPVQPQASQSHVHVVSHHPSDDVAVSWASTSNGLTSHLTPLQPPAASQRQEHGELPERMRTLRSLQSTKPELLELLGPFLPRNTLGPKREGTSGWLRTQLQKDYHDQPWTFAFFLPIRCTQFVLRPLAKMADSDTVAASALRVPMFYAYSGSDSQNDAQTKAHASLSTDGALLGSLRRDQIDVQSNFHGSITQEFVDIYLEAIDTASQPQSHAYLASCVIGVVFGMVHLLAWSATFATTIERKLWRLSAVVITVVPAIVAIGWPWLRYLVIFRKQEVLKKRRPKIAKVGKFIQVGIPVVLGVPFYVLARFTLLTLALISLRDLPPGVHTAVSWTSFIPHF
ncbi:hypothetical protein D9619_008553 [Psilocybe cf. subviscida]|uniref:Uncharacterized protein n=1 Tax=Psilocybe cf. subviscida TaxID=2480587 RepID=A0A8H5F134_9AGAR|nr:hypothetical protein D9619_008553 [Psilocybe cf. subviscida]